MNRVTVENDISPVAIVMAVKGKDLVLDPSAYSVGAEIKIQDALDEEVRLTAEGKKSEALRHVVGVLHEVIGPSNPDWTAEEMLDKMTKQELGWCIGFFEVMSPSGGKIKQETVEKFVNILTGKEELPSEEEEEEEPEGEGLAEELAAVMPEPGSTSTMKTPETLTQSPLPGIEGSSGPS